jgi:RNA polymerase sigma-70 factor (ECF subfamily)
VADTASVGRVNVEEYRGRVFRFLRARLPREDAEDLTQEVLISAWRSAFRGTCKPEAWLFRIATNALRDHVRRAGCRPETQASRAEEPTDPGAWGSPKAALLDMEVEDALRSVDPSLRRVWELARRGFSTREIAGTVGIPEGTVKTRLRRVRGRVAEGLELAA